MANQKQTLPSSTKTTINVGIEIKAIPDGLIDNGDYYLISLMLNPIALSDCSETGEGGIPLENWPSAIAALHDNITIKFGGNDLNDIKVIDCISQEMRSEKRHEIDALWQMTMRLYDENIRKDIDKYFSGTSDAKLDIFKGLTVSHPPDVIALGHQTVQGTTAALEAARSQINDKVSRSATTALNHLSPTARHSALTNTLYHIVDETNGDKGENGKSVNTSNENGIREDKEAREALRRIANSGRTRKSKTDVSHLFSQSTISDIKEILGESKKIAKAIDVDEKKSYDSFNETLRGISPHENRIFEEDDLANLQYNIIQTLLPFANRSKDKKQVGPSPFTRAYAQYILSMMPDEAGEETGTQVARSSAEADQPPLFLRWLTGLFANPQVASLFGLIVDVKVPKKSIKKITNKLQAKIGSKAQTAHVTHTQVRDETFYAVLRPLPGYLKQLLSHLSGDGVVKLGSEGRFCLMSLDSHAALEGGTNAHNNDVSGLNNGEMITEQESGSPAHRTTGLSIIDKRAHWNAILDQFTTVLREKKGDANKSPQEFYLDDLVAGFRIDVGVSEPEKREWFSLFNRVLEYPDIEQIGIRYDTGHPMFVRERSNGYARKAHREAELGGKPLAVVFETLMSWRNWSLALPQKGDVYELKSDEANGDNSGDELQLSITMKAPQMGKKLQNPQKKAARKDLLPPLRIGREYCFGARIVLDNGSSIAFDDAVHKYEESNDELILKTGGKHAIIKEGDGGFPFLRHEPITGPLFLDPKQPDQPQNPTETKEPIEHHAPLDTITVTSGDPKALKWDSAKRLVLAGGVPFDLCELSGTFDTFKNTLPQESYKNIVMKKGGTTELFYADPLAQVMMIGFFKNGEPAWPGAYPEPLAIDLGGPWPNYKPITFKVSPTNNAGQFQGGSGLRAEFSRFRANTLEIKIEPAEIAEMRIWFLPRRFDDLKNLAGFQQMEYCADKLANFGMKRRQDRGPYAALWEALENLAPANKNSILPRQFSSINKSDISTYDPLFCGPLTGICHSGRLTIVHAVEKPLEAPVISNLWGLHRMNIDADGTASEEDILAAWAHFVMTNNMNGDALPVDNFLKGQQPNSQHFLILGSLDINRRSTSELVLMGAWQDFGPHTKVQKNTEGIFVDHPSLQCDPITEIKPISYEPRGTEKENSIDLVLDHAGRPRTLHVKLKSTRAVEMLVAADARSRFARYFTKQDAASKSASPASLGNEDKRFVFPAEPRHVKRSQTYKVLKIPSSKRPDPVVHLGIESAIYLEGQRHFDLPAVPTPSVYYGLKRKVVLRINLSEEWYSSGFGEQLGVVCWPPDLFTSSDASIHKKVPDRKVPDRKEIPEWASVWGRDPVRETGEINRLLPASAFVNCKEKTTGTIPLSEDNQNGEREIPTPCALALFDVEVDPDTGARYCDIEIDPGNSYNPFVRLGLVRYQPCSLAGLHASTPIIVHASIMPAREVSLEKTHEGFSLTYAGAIYSEMNFSAHNDHKSIPTSYNTPLIDVTVMHHLPRDRVKLEKASQTETPTFSGLPVHAGSETIHAKIAEIVNLAPTSVIQNQAEWKINFVSTAVGHSSKPKAINCECAPELQLEEHFFHEGIAILIRESEHMLGDIDGQFHDKAPAPSDSEASNRWVKRVICSSLVNVSVD